MVGAGGRPAWREGGRLTRGGGAGGRQLAGGCRKAAAVAAAGGAGAVLLRHPMRTVRVVWEVGSRLVLLAGLLLVYS